MPISRDMAIFVLTTTTTTTTTTRPITLPPCTCARGNYTLSRKKKDSIIGTLGSGWDCKFYMGTQNGSNYEL